MRVDREKVLRDAIFQAIEIVMLEWDVTPQEVLNALHVTRKAIKEKLLVDGSESDDRA